jgi:hypothetical protein
MTTPWKLSPFKVTAKCEKISSENNGRNFSMVVPIINFTGWFLMVHFYGICDWNVSSSEWGVCERGSHKLPIALTMLLILRIDSLPHESQLSFKMKIRQLSHIRLSHSRRSELLIILSNIFSLFLLLPPLIHRMWLISRTIHEDKKFTTWKHNV